MFNDENANTDEETTTPTGPESDARMFAAIARSLAIVERAKTHTHPFIDPPAATGPRTFDPLTGTWN